MFNILKLILSFSRREKLCAPEAAAIMRRHLFFVVLFVSFLPLSGYAQQNDSSVIHVIVQPGAPGQATKVLPSSTRAKLPPHSAKDVEFMQHMIVHHAQAVEMTALIEARTENKNIHLLGKRISQSQSDEIKFMTQWLARRGEPSAPPTAEKNHKNAASHDMSNHQHHHPAPNNAAHLMPGMLTPAQMEALKKAKDAEFDRLFLSGMIQHHVGALIMVKELFETSGAGQDAELFNFATDVDSGQRAEISSMQNLLDKQP